MDRRAYLKTMALGAFASGSLLENLGQPRDAAAFESRWHRWPDMRWAGPQFWGNRLQDWHVQGGSVECQVSGRNRTLHCLTRRLSARSEAFETAVAVQVLSEPAAGYVGFRLGAKGPFADYRSDAVFGKGLDAGVTAEGSLFIGDEHTSDGVATGSAVQLHLQARPRGEQYQLMLTAYPENSDQPLASVQARGISNEALSGNVALIAHFDDETEGPSARFGGWSMQGPKFISDPAAAFGPVMFAQYTLHRGTLKLTAQLAPIEEIEDGEVALEMKENGAWRALRESAVDPLARIARFRVDNWDHRDDVPYRIRVTLPLRGGRQDFFYEGTIAREPFDDDKLKVAVFSCNADHGFPNADVVRHIGEHRPHMAVFLGDQLYESHGGFGIQRSPLEKAALDFLHKWYMFGWSYRDIFRHIPVAVIPDDHDVYHGNVWGSGGKEAPTDQGWGYDAQDAGGYKMPPTWVNMVQRAQTSHLPDPYDPTPVKQGIGVYYTGWNYAGVSLAILEDRKFKSAPQNVLPEEAEVENGFIQNPEAFDVKQHRHLAEARLLGERQMKFLEDWATDWSGGVEMKVVLSQTNFGAVHTLPAGSTGDQMVPQLPMPEPGEYVQGDEPVADMDTNGWPMNRRDEVLRLIRKGFAFHIAGDQHLATVVRYGVDDFEDAGFAFTGPALNNIWPRRWWPPQEEKQYALPGKPAYTGGFFDGFGNRLAVHAAANPRRTGLEPSIIYDRVTGYGIVTFDKRRRTIHMECWPRYADPARDPDGQYEDWPIIVSQEDNYGREAQAWLPEIRVDGLDNPVVVIINERTGEAVYALRIRGQTFRPGVFEEGRYTIRVGEPDRDLFQEHRNIAATAEEERSLAVRF